MADELPGAWMDTATLIGDVEPRLAHFRTMLDRVMEANAGSGRAAAPEPALA